MNLNLSKFKKLKEDKHSAILKHPDGHEFHISKQSLTPDHQKELASIPMHYDQGGQSGNPIDQVADAENSQNASYDPSMQKQQPVNVVINNHPQGSQEQPGPPQQEPDRFASTQRFGGRNFEKEAIEDPSVPAAAKMEALQRVAAQNQILQNQRDQESQKNLKAYQEAVQYNQMAKQNGLPPVNVPEAPAMLSGQSAGVKTASLEDEAPGLDNNQKVPDSGMAVPQAPQDPYGTEAAYNSFNKGIQEKTAGIQGEAAATAEQGKQQAAVYQEGIQKQQETLNNFKQNESHFFEQRALLQQDYQNGHIDPQHYLNSKGAVGKISSAIGLILGGMGGGLTHQANPALEFLKSQIENDIGAQRSEMDKKHNLLSANSQTLGDLRAGAEMTRINLNDIVSHKIAMAAAQSQDPIAKARAQQAIGQLQLDSSDKIGQMAMRRTLMANMAKPAAVGGGDKTPQLIDMLRMTNPELAKNYESRYVPGVGLGHVPVPEKVREELVSRQNLDDMIADLSKFAKDNSGNLDPSIMNQGSAKAKLVQDAYRSANGQGVFREAEKNFVESIVDQDPTKFFSSIRTLPKYKELEENNLSRLNGLKKGYGLPSRFVPKSQKDFAPNSNSPKVATRGMNNGIK